MSKTFFARGDLSNPREWNAYKQLRDEFIACFPTRAEGLKAWREASEPERWRTIAKHAHPHWFEDKPR